MNFEFVIFKGSYSQNHGQVLKSFLFQVVLTSKNQIWRRLVFEGPIKSKWENNILKSDLLDSKVTANCNSGRESGNPIEREQEKPVSEVFTIP